jgi:cell wall-associated NlpC family hydrolase
MQGMAVSRQALKPGDLLFFYVPGRFRSNSIIGHVGLYIGGGQMIHATPSAPSGVKITSIDSSYWKQKFLSARRVATPL